MHSTPAGLQRKSLPNTGSTRENSGKKKNSIDNARCSQFCSLGDFAGAILVIFVGTQMKVYKRGKCYC